MKQVVLLFIFLLLFSPGKAYSHSAGYPPFFKIDGKIAATYPLSDVGVFSPTFEIPQDITPENYVVGEKISFEIDTEILESVFPPEVIRKTKYRWDFGDGIKKDGVKNDYIYKKPGSYILEIIATYNEPDKQPQMIESVLVNVLPDENYQLPKAIIKVNNKSGTSDNYNILDFDLNNPLTLNGSESFSKSSKIINYTWDFGDDRTRIGKIVKHQYILPQAFATVVLRVTDENGFFADSYINVRNSGKNEPNNSQISPLIIATGVLFLSILGFVFLQVKNTKNKK